jgi:hypothetical protein
MLMKPMQLGQCVSEGLAALGGNEKRNRFAHASRSLWRRPMISWIKRAGAFLWRTLDAASGGRSDAMYDDYEVRLSRLEVLALGEFKARISRLEAVVQSADVSARAGGQAVREH